MTTPPTGPSPGRLSSLIARVTRALPSRDGAPLSLSELKGSETAKAAGLAGSMIANNVIALGSTIVFARLLKNSQGGGYGSLAALVSYFLILSVVGQALQVATAREGVLGQLGSGHGLMATVRRWTTSLLAFTLVLTVISVLLRQQIADLVGVKHTPWAAALGLPAAGLYLELCVLRGVLQGVGDYKGVGFSLIGEQAMRLVAGAILVVAGAGLTGAYAGTPLSFIVMSCYCAWRLKNHVEAETGESLQTRAALAPAALSMRAHVRRAWAPISGLIIIAVLQNIDIIGAKHRFSTSVASSYSAVAVAAKVLIWVAMGAGFYLVPEVSRRRAAGEDPRPILGRALGIVAVCAVPVLLIYAFASHPLIKAAFGASKTQASGSLLVLGLAFSALACTYLAIQYLLAQHRMWFLAPLAVVAIAEPILLLNAPSKPTGFAAVVLGVQVVGAIVAFAFALSPDRRSPRTQPRDGSDEAADIEPIPEPVS
jgi:O-antigen/teichoic acid export membrane protein